MTQGPSREPWWKCKVGLRRSPKMAALPNDSARLGWVYVLSEAKLQPRMGAFLDRKALVELMGRYGRYFDDWVFVGLAEIAPALCDRCAAKHPDAAQGEVIVHDYRREQMDPSNADRQAAWREAHAAPQRPVRNGKRNGGRNGTKRYESTETVTPNVTADSRARGTTVTETETERGESQVPTVVPARDRTRRPPVSGFTRAGDVDLRGPLLDQRQHDAWTSFGSDWDQVKDAWLARGLRYPLTGAQDEEGSQREILWQFLRDWPEHLPEWIAQAPKGASAMGVIGYVIERFHLARQESLEAAEARESEWFTVKAEDAATAPAILADLQARAS